MIQSFLITADDVTNLHNIWTRPGSSVGETVKNRQDKHGHISMPKDLVVIHKCVTLAVDVMFVNSNLS